jgi:tetratricopeptide (TPR) repeat protein
LNKYPEAIEALRRAAEVAPNDADIQYNMARVYFATGDEKAQKTAAENALAKGTKFPGEAFYLLGDAEQKLRNGKAAIDAYQKAINSKPDIYLAYRNLAETFRNEGQFNDAIAISKKALLLYSNDGNIYTDLSWYYSLAGRPEDAIQAAKAGITFLPNQSTAYTNLCRAYNEVKSYDLAINACNSALRLLPNDGETYYYLGNALVGQDKSVEATRMYTRAVTGLQEYTAKNPNYSDGWYLLGNALFADKQYDKAIEAYQKCLSLSPRFLKARVNLGITFTRKKNKSAALEQYNLLLPADAALAARLKAEIDKM